MVTVAPFVKLQAKPGKEKDIICILERGLILANQESTKPVWFALQPGSSAFGIPDASTDEEGQNAHLTGPIVAALMANADELLTEPPKMKHIDVLTTKISG